MQKVSDIMQRDVLKMIYLAIMAIFIYGPVSGFDGQYNFSRISTKDGLSQLSVLTIFQDSKGYMWFGTRDGLNRFDGQSFKHWYSDLNDSSSISDNYIRCISEDSKGNIWIGTRFGLNRFDRKTGRFSHYFIDDRKTSGESNTIKTMYIDRKSDMILVGSFSGLYSFNPDSGSFSRINEVSRRVNDIKAVGDSVFVGTYSGLYLIAGDIISFFSPFSSNAGTGTVAVDMITPDNDGNLWLSSYKNGLICIDPETWDHLDRFDFPDKQSIVKNEIRAMASISDKYMMLGTNAGLFLYDRTNKHADYAGQQFSKCPIESIYTDDTGGIWVGTYSEGIGYSHPYIDRFKHHGFPEENLSAGTAGPMLICNNVLYIGTEGRGLVTYSLLDKKFRSYPCIPHSTNTFRDNNVKSLYLHEGILYIGLYSGQVYLFDITDNTYVDKFDVAGSPPVYAITEYAGKILAGTYSSDGIRELIPGIGFRKAEFVGIDSTKIAQVSSLFRSGNNLYIGTKADGLYRYDGKGLNHYVIQDDGYMTGKMISVIKEDSKGNLLIGTQDAGMNILRSGSRHFGKLTRDDGLNDNMICSILEDSHGVIWVITHGGISRLNDDFSVSNTYTWSSGLTIEEFQPSSATVSENNMIYAGGNNGFISFNPDNLSNNPDSPPVQIEEILVNNEPYEVPYENGLELSWRQNNLTFRYITLNYIYSEQNFYICKLDGIKDTTWTEMGNSRTINYASLSPGKYIFKVRSANNDGIWTGTITEIPIHIRPPFWMSVPAFILYMMILVLSTIFVIHYLLIRQDLKHQVLTKQNEKMFYQARIDLFTKFSHELRTPLMLIQGPIEEVMETNDPSKMDMSSFKMVHNNLNRLRMLIDQLLTFRKKESGSLKINVSAGDFNGFAREIRLAFNELAGIHDIDFRLEEGKIPTDIWYDRAMFERVLMNILSNAFKYTPDGGTIKMILDSAPAAYADRQPKVNVRFLDRTVSEYLRIRIEDSGPGIPEDSLDKVFEPFFQISDNKGGTGLGLTLSSEIVRLHHGAIWAENRSEGGAVFTILIPVGHAHFSESDIIHNYQDSENINRYYKENKDLSEAIKPAKECTILIVEDNRELREYIVGRLSAYFRTLQAADGREGLIAARTHMPSLIVSDIMMPIMDGLAMCREIKTDPHLCHIPVILLTARSLSIQMQEGLNLGADDYITKPFNINMLALKISNMLFSRENLKNLYAKDLTIRNMGIDIQSQDEKFLQKLNEVVAQKISDTDLDVGEFCSLLGMSRSSLYRKLQAATGLSPSKYLMKVRLHIASRMLKETGLAIQEIVDAVGFTNAAHFSVSFKKQYGISPTQFRLQNSHTQ